MARKRAKSWAMSVYFKGIRHVPGRAEGAHYCICGDHSSGGADGNVHLRRGVAPWRQAGACVVIE